MRKGILFAAMLGVGALTACTQERSIDWKVGAHTFRVPKDFVVDANVFYLPPSQSNSLRFVINPNAALPEQILVSIDPTAKCPYPFATPPPNERCQAMAIPIRLLESDRLMKSQNPADFQWEYRSEKHGNILVNCSPLRGRNGLCIHDGLYQDVPYTIYLRDSDVPNLLSVRRKIETKLAEWEAAAQ